LDLFGWQELTIFWRIEARRAGVYASKEEMKMKLNCPDRVASSAAPNSFMNADAAVDALDAPDPLLALQRRYQAELKAF
jgi:hypothetical protein